MFKNTTPANTITKKNRNNYLRDVKYKNYNYKNDIDYVVKISRTLLTPIGIYPLHGSDTTISKILVNIQIICIFSLMLFLLAPHLIYTYFVAEDLKRLIKIIAAQFFNSLALIKFWTMIINKKQLRWCLNELEDSWRDIASDEDRKIMIKNAKIGRIFTVAYLSLSYGGALPYHIIMPLVAPRIIMPDNSTLIPLPYPSEYIFWVPRDSPGYEMLFVGQILISSIILSTNCGIYSLIATYIMHACCLFEIVQRHLKYILESSVEGQFNDNLAAVIDKHNQAIYYAGLLEKSLNIVFLSEMAGCTVIICFLEYGVLLEWGDGDVLGLTTYFMLLTSIFVNVFIISYIGERLKEMSLKIGECTYDLDWYNLPKKMALDLMVIMVRANQPSTLSAGKLFDLSLVGFADVSIKIIILYFSNNYLINLSLYCQVMVIKFLQVVKTSAAYLNFIRAMTNPTNMKNKSQSIQVSTKENINYSTQLTRWVLTALGVWTNENKKTINDKILSTALIIMCYFSNFFLLIPCSLHTILSEKDMSLKMKALGPLTFCVMAIGKFSFLVKRKKDIYNCFKHVYHDWRRVQLINDENIMLENAKRGRFITILCAAFMYGGGLFYNTIMPFAVGSFVTADNKTIKPLTYAVYDPLFSAQETPNYQIVFTLQWFTGFFLCSITFGACSLAAVFAFHACGQLKIIISRLDNFIDRNHNFDDVLKKKMADIIELHLRTLRFIVRVEKLLNEINLIEFLGCTFMICLCVYYLLTELKNAEAISIITYCVLLVSFNCNIFIFCHIGEMLTQQGEEVGWAAYNNNQWYKLSKKNSRGLILIMAMSNCPCSLSAGKMVNLSYASFASVIKTAMTYLNIIRTTVL
ncbi:uncharacterized protein LOC122851058 [Aphidius gifuensis]|uniref:uncharacterized protein LOC122851058 n=1 Tax=Aphidius gifuensis TaxID=684658 RepID=UPI001CDB8738|nr:uncharacterized protein LOC122851058 [Aphidius gifuensis]